MICASVREYNPRALVSGLSSIQMHKPYTNFLIAPAYIHLPFVHCEIFDIKHFYINERCNNKTNLAPTANLVGVCFIINKSHCFRFIIMDGSAGVIKSNINNRKSGGRLFYHHKHQGQLLEE